jgi:rare lipoprotein A
MASHLDDLGSRSEKAPENNPEEAEEPPGDPLSTLMAPDAVYFERGGASWYGIELHRRRTASGERFNMNAMTAAHRTLAFGTRVCVRNLNNGKEVLVRINDRGPHAMGRIIDVSRAAALALDLMGVGIKEVALSLPVVTGLPCGN